MATRLLLVAHAPTDATRAVRFATRDDRVADPDLPTAITRRVRSAECGASHAMRQTARALGVDVTEDPAWDGRDLGDWSGAPLTELAPSDVGHWVATPHLAPRGGESVESLVRRVSRRLDRGFDDGLHVIVTSTDVLRAAVLAVTAAQPAAFAAVDVAPLDALEITLNLQRRAVRSLRPYPDWL